MPSSAETKLWTDSAAWKVCHNDRYTCTPWHLSVKCPSHVPVPLGGSKSRTNSTQMPGHRLAVAPHRGSRHVVTTAICLWRLNSTRLWALEQSTRLQEEGFPDVRIQCKARALCSELLRTGQGTDLSSVGEPLLTRPWALSLSGRRWGQDRERHLVCNRPHFLLSILDTSKDLGG